MAEWVSKAGQNTLLSLQKFIGLFSFGLGSNLHDATANNTQLSLYLTIILIMHRIMQQYRQQNIIIGIVNSIMNKNGNKILETQ